jgi:prepilin-type N-terminal cleavage/methylation domain-containing protein
MFKKNMVQTTYYQLPARKGFTLIEVLVSIVILVVVIGGIVALESGNIKTGTSSKFNIQANGLGQEAMNIVKGIGDKVKLGSTEPATIADKCVDPNNPKTCKGGFYYLDNSELKRCTSCRDTGGSPTAATTPCPYDKAEVNTTINLVCAESDSTKKVNEKDFTRTVIIPYVVPPAVVTP